MPRCEVRLLGKETNRLFCRGEGGGEGGTGFGFKQQFSRPIFFEFSFSFTKGPKLVPPLKVALFVVNLCLSCFGEIVK